MSKLFAPGGQSIAASASASVFPRIISFRIDWFDLLAVQVTLKSLLQHHSLKESVLWCSAFFIVQLSHLYMTTGKIIDLTIQSFVDKVMSLLFNTLGLSWLFFKGPSVLRTVFISKSSPFLQYLDSTLNNDIPRLS